MSYYQAAVANEVYLETIRQRVSVRRHARLIDYHMHDGASAPAFIHVSVSALGALLAGTQVLTRMDAPLESKMPPHGSVIAAAKTGHWPQQALSLRRWKRPHCPPT